MIKNPISKEERVKRFMTMARADKQWHPLKSRLTLIVKYNFHYPKYGFENRGPYLGYWSFQSPKKDVTEQWYDLITAFHGELLPNVIQMSVDGKINNPKHTKIDRTIKIITEGEEEDIIRTGYDIIKYAKYRGLELKFTSVDCRHYMPHVKHVEEGFTIKLPFQSHV